MTYNQISAQFNEKEILDAQVKEIVVLLLLGWSETMTEQSFEGRGNIFVNIFFFPRHFAGYCFWLQTLNWSSNILKNRKLKIVSNPWTLEVLKITVLHKDTGVDEEYWIAELLR